MSLYDPDSQFSMSALSRLEDKGIQILTTLETFHKQLAEVAGVTFTRRVSREYNSKLRSRDSVEIVIRQWTLGARPALPPTWRSLPGTARNGPRGTEPANRGIPFQ